MGKFGHSLARLAAVLALLPPAAAAAIDCREWTAMTADQKTDWLSERIRWGVQKSADARKIQVDRAAMRRCMMGRVPTIADDFDDICAEGIHRPANALDDSLQHHFWSCVGAENR
jgi:hypothetical protein